jgi:excisionase family DNA binding protein
VSERLVTARELAEQLGLSPSTVLDMWERGELPAFKIGRAVRFRPSEVEAWLESCRRGPRVASSHRPLEVL